MKIYFILRKLLINLGILERIGYQALGEKNTYFINPFKNNSLNIIYTSHNLEHLTSETSDNFFRECKRLLKRNGEILIEVPDAEYIHMNALNYIKDENTESINQLLNYGTQNNQIFFSDYVFNYYSNFENSRKWLRNPLVMVYGGYLGCFMDPPHQSCHIPIIKNPKIIAEKMTELKMTDFFDWWFDHMTPEQKNSGGHTSAWYLEKIKRKGSEWGFEISPRHFRESSKIYKIFQKYFIPDRPHRGFTSLRVKAIKI